MSFITVDFYVFVSSYFVYIQYFFDRELFNTHTAYARTHTHTQIYIYIYTHAPVTTTQ